MEPTTTILGRVFPTNRGEWEVGVAYELLDVVAHEGTGGIYLCLEAHNSEGPSEPEIQGSSKWGILCGKGTLGSVPTYAFSEDGFSLSIENPDGTMGEAVNIRGAAGEQGDRGEPGELGPRGQQGPEGFTGAINPGDFITKQGDNITVLNQDGSRGRTVYVRGDRGPWGDNGGNPPPWPPGGRR